MPDINFDCPVCGHNLEVSEKGAGMTVPCPECSNTITIPFMTAEEENTLSLDCPYCKQSLGAPFDMAGQLIDCPSCNKAIVIPFGGSSPKIEKAPTKTTPFANRLTPKGKLQRAVLWPLIFFVCVSVLILVSIFGMYRIWPFLNNATENNKVSSTSDELGTKHSGSDNDIKASSTSDDSWTKYSGSDNDIYVQNTNDMASLVVAQYWAADYLDRVQYTCFADELTKTDAFREHYQQALAKGQNNPWNDPGTFVRISKSAPITWLKSVDSSVWRIVEVRKGTVTNTHSACYILNASANPPKILWSPNKLRIENRSEVYKIFEATKDPLFGELLYLQYYGKCKAQFPSLPLLDYQVSTEIIESFPEKLRDLYGILWGEFMRLNDRQDMLPGITVESNGLISRVRVSEKEKHLGFNLQLYARVGEKVQSSSFFYCFTRKAPSSFEKWKSIERGTYLFMLGRFITLDRSGGALGFYATQVMTYNLAEDKWICLTE